MKKPAPLWPRSSPDWCRTEDRFHAPHVFHYESIFALANGYAGVRGSPEMSIGLGEPGVFAAGVYDETGRGPSAEIVNLPSWLDLSINIDGFELDLRRCALRSYRRVLDLRQGLLFTDLVWRDGANHTTRYESVRLLHKTEKHLGLILGRLTALDYSADLQVGSRLDAWRVRHGSASGRNHFRDLETGALEGGGIGLRLTTLRTGIGVALASRLRADGADAGSVTAEDDRVEERLRVRAEQGKPVVFEKRAALFTSRDVGDPAAAAAAELSRLAGVTAQTLLQGHADAWAAVWRDADIRVRGDRRSQRALRFNAFHLASLACPDDERVSLGAKGLHGNGYAGLVFWDTEIYLLPFYIYTDPAAARALLMYRYHTLGEARQNARAAGLRGAHYPWNSSHTAREGFRKGWQEHVGADVAYGVDHYVKASGDLAFYLDAGAELILSTATYWLSRVTFDAARGGYVLTGLMGPDEIHGGIDNNAFTNHFVIWHARRALAAVDDLKLAGRWGEVNRRTRLRAADLEAWRDLAERMVEPYHPRRGFHEQFDGYFQLKERAIDRSISRMAYTGPVQHSFRPTKVAQQADTVLMYYLFAEDFTEAMRRKGFAYYEPRCSHTSSLSKSIYATEAAQLGRAKEAYRLFLESAENDFAPGSEPETESGIHAACMGGTWQTAVMGFLGFRAGADGPSFRPRLPAGWEQVSLRLRWRGAVLDLVLSPERLRVKTDGARVPVTVNGRAGVAARRWTSLPLRPA